MISMGALFISTACLVSSHEFSETTYRAYERDRREFQRATREYLALDDEERLIRSYLPRFEALTERGILGEEQRLNWMETLRKTKASLKLPVLLYKIYPRQIRQSDWSGGLGDYEVFASTMEISAQLLHEEDLLRLLDELARRALGTFLVDSCSLSRVNEETQLDITKPNLSARCELSWVTLRQRPERGGRAR